MKPDTIVITHPTLKDVETLWRWGEENWELWGDEKNKWFSKQSIIRWIQEPEDDVLLVAQDGSRCIGMCIVNVIRDWAFCFGLFVEERYRGQGIGKRLIDEAERLLTKQGIDVLILLVDDKNSRATAFYEREGFYKGFNFCMMTKELPKKPRA